VSALAHLRSPDLLHPNFIRTTHREGGDPRDVPRLSNPRRPPHAPRILRTSSCVLNSPFRIRALIFRQSAMNLGFRSSR
jgi:hypothetical protein